MVDCELMSTCLFFNDQMANMPNMAEMQKKKYCHGNYNICARYKVYKALGREKVPKNLFPIELNKVDQIISQG